MATTVKSAFDEFLSDTVNLDKDVVSEARKSRDNLLDNIAEFDNKDGFFKLCSDFNVQFGSFARKTKCRELDDIDLMIGISARGAKYNWDDEWNDVRIISSDVDVAQKACTRWNGTLDSTLVANRFKKKLESVREYSRSEIRRNGEAVILNLVSKEWSFDVVPCFYTEPEADGRAYYLIPNGKGDWMKTDPNIDRDHVQNTNKIHNGTVLELIRLCKRWNRVKKTITLPSYLLETMIINYADSRISLSNNIGVRFRDALMYIANKILYSVCDMKGIQGDINNLSADQKIEILLSAKNDGEKASFAIALEERGYQEDAVKKWGEIFGGDFPVYG